MEETSKKEFQDECFSIITQNITSRGGFLYYTKILIIRAQYHYAMQNLDEARKSVEEARKNLKQIPAQFYQLYVHIWYCLVNYAIMNNSFECIFSELVKEFKHLQKDPSRMQTIQEIFLKFEEQNKYFSETKNGVKSSIATLKEFKKASSKVCFVSGFTRFIKAEKKRMQSIQAAIQELSRLNEKSPKKGKNI